MELEIRRITGDEQVDDHMRMAYELALLGLTEEQMSQVLGVSFDRIQGWKKRYSEFERYLAEGKTIADAKVAMALYRRATGYDYEEDHVTVFQGDVTVTRVRKHIPADPWSAAKWLALRQRTMWSEAQRVEVTNTWNINMNKLDFHGISDEALKLMAEIGLNQLPQDARQDG